MATVNTKIDVNLGNSDATIAELRQQYKELLKSIGETTQGTQEYYAKLKQLASIKGDLQDLKEDIRKLDPQSTFSAIQGVAQGLVGGFTAATGAVALFSDKNKELEETLVKVNSSVALLGGFQSLNDGLRQARSLLALSTGEFGALLAAITLVGGAIAYFALQTSEAEKVTKALDEINKEAIKNASEEAAKIEILTATLNDHNLTQKQRKDLLTEVSIVTGKEVKNTQDANIALQEYTKSIIDNARVKASQTKISELTAEILKAEKDISDFSKFAEEESKRTGEAVDVSAQIKDRRDKIRNLYTEIEGIVKQSAGTEKQVLNQASFDAQQAEIDKNKRIIAARQASGYDTIGLQAKTLEQEANLIKAKIPEKLATEKDYSDKLNEIVVLRNQRNLTALQDYESKAEAIDAKIKFLQAQPIDLSAIAAEAKARAEALSGAVNAKSFDVKKIRNPITGLTEDEANAKIQRDFDSQQNVLLDQRANGLINEQTYQDQLLQLQVQSLEKQKQVLITNGESTVEIDKKISEAKVQILDREQASRKQILTSISGDLNAFAELAGKQTVVGKALAVASTLINTYQSATEAYKSLAGIPTIGPALGIAAAAAAIASGLANVKQILAVKVPSTSGGGSTSLAGSTSTIPALPPQTSIQTVNTILNPSQVSQLNPANIPSPVVSVIDINAGINRVRTVERNNSIGLTRIP